MTTPRILPSIDDLRRRTGVEQLVDAYGAEATLDTLREVTGRLRDDLQSGAAADVRDREGAARRLEAAAQDQLAARFAPSLRGVINATGVIVHTNLGRAPLAASAAAHAADLAGSYGNLEFDLARGGRGVRSTHAEEVLRLVTGAPAAVVVNNNAAAVMLLLAALADGREVIVSRGELVEIGGGFRVPDVMRQSGAVVREVGTTNKTRVADYAAALNDRTGLILRVHPSNFRIEGFAERPTIEELVALGRRFDVPIAEDLGSGLLAPTTVPALRDEPTVRGSVSAGVDVCCFSGDKLLGGPQAGVLVGTTAALEPIRRHPLMRTLRVDKLTYAALEATLLEHARGRARQTVPVVRMIHADADAIGARASALARRLAEHPSIRATVVDGMSTVGGGSAPGSALPTRLIRLTPKSGSAAQLEQKLRGLTPPVVARVEQDAVLLDLRTVLPEQDEGLATLLAALTLG